MTTWISLHVLWPLRSPLLLFINWIIVLIKTVGVILNDVFKVGIMIKALSNPISSNSLSATRIAFLPILFLLRVLHFFLCLLFYQL